MLASKISGEGQGASIAALLPEGMRAATVRINDVSGVAGFVQPNDSVDVLITRTPPGGQPTQLTDVLLQNVRVIAIDQEAKNRDGTPKLARTATFEVTPIDAQKLALAQQVGQSEPGAAQAGRAEQPGRRDRQHERPALQHVRRGALSGAGRRSAITGAALTEGITVPTADRRRRAGRRPRRRSQAAPEKPKVEVFRGTKSNEYKVGGYGGLTDTGAQRSRPRASPAWRSPSRRWRRSASPRASTRRARRAGQQEPGAAHRPALFQGADRQSRDRRRPAADRELDLRARQESRDDQPDACTTATTG